MTLKFVFQKIGLNAERIEYQYFHSPFQLCFYLCQAVTLFLSYSLSLPAFFCLYPLITPFPSISIYFCHLSLSLSLSLSFSLPLSLSLFLSVSLSLSSLFLCILFVLNLLFSVSYSYLTQQDLSNAACHKTNFHR